MVKTSGSKLNSRESLPYMRLLSLIGNLCNVQTDKVGKMTRLELCIAAGRRG